MDVMKNRCHSCRSNCIIQLGKCCHCCCNDITEDTNSMTLSAIGSSKLRWKVLWMKLKKEKKKLFESYASSHSQPLHHAPYDPYTYSQNFDQGTAKDEPENLSRSFSARFADPSRVVIVKKRVV